MKLHFIGGIDTVTGSQHIIECNGKRVLRDCGLFQGRRSEAFKVNRELRFDVSKIDAAVLSHAHVDHCGNIPTLARYDFNKPIYTTTATKELMTIMLLDAAHIQEQDAFYMNQRKSRQGQEPIIPLYTVADAEAVLPLFEGLQYGDTVTLGPGFTVKFNDAGHILGSAVTSFNLEEDGRKVKVGYALDLGRSDLPLIRDPHKMKDLDVLVMESTYGNRTHDDATMAGGQLQKIIQKTYDRGGKVLIPSFALERTQEILYHIATLVADGKLPKIPVYVDSPMATNVTKVFKKMTDYLDEEALDLRGRIGSSFPPWVKFTSSVEESKALTSSKEPAIVLSASGMCEHGRILHHLKHGIDNPKNTIVFVGYQAFHTLGRRIIEGLEEVRIFGDTYEVNCEIEVLHAFSAHADRNDLVAYAKQSSAKKVFLVHGEHDQREMLADRLRMDGMKVFTPANGDVVEI